MSAFSFDREKRLFIGIFSKMRALNISWISPISGSSVFRGDEGGGGDPETIIHSLPVNRSSDSWSDLRRSSKYSSSRNP